MPINRTPPASTIPTPVAVETMAHTPVYSQGTETRRTLQESPLQHCDSAPDLHDLSSDIAEQIYKKRKYERISKTEGVTTSISLMIEEMFSTFSREQERRFHELQCTISNLTEQNCELRDCVNMMSAKYDEFLIKISALESKRQDDKKTILQLEDKLEALEQIYN
ncbi:hypothetical protein PYW07_017469 [Mythimna separata]|uniref:Uncharacterized protein n=1 Tax=Mythimna separata TaxID=271217 RepID=A0AAD8DYF4_MYTSE|nr:hypothetical protein PYW07_017469 [Mythimna separata]